MPNRRTNRLNRQPQPPQGQERFTARSLSGEWMFDVQIRADLVDDELIEALHRFIERKNPSLRLVASS